MVLHSTRVLYARSGARSRCIWRGADMRPAHGSITPGLDLPSLILVQGNINPLIGVQSPALMKAHDLTFASDWVTKVGISAVGRFGHDLSSDCVGIIPRFAPNVKHNRRWHS